MRRASQAKSMTGEVTLTERQRELIGYLKVEDNVAVFARDEIIPDWKVLKACMVALGGKWNRKGFVFSDEIDAAELVRVALLTGKIVDPKAADFFWTPAHVVYTMLERVKPKPGDYVLEPSAGSGHIAGWIRSQHPQCKLLCVESRAAACRELERSGLAVNEADFLSLDLGPAFDVIVMNPPFSRRQDILHVQHAVTQLAPGGRLAAIMSAGVVFRTDRLATDFRALVTKHRGQIEELPDDTFKEAGTSVRTVLVTLRK